MAFVYKRNKIYYVSWREWAINDKGERVRVIRSKPISPDHETAKAYAARKTLDAYSDKNKTLKRNIPIQTFFMEYETEYASKKKQPSTIKLDNLTWSHFRRLLPSVAIAEQFDDDALNTYIYKRQQENVTCATINRELGMLCSLARWGYKRRFLSSNYYDLVDDLPEIDSQKKRAFTDDEIQKIIDNTTYPQREAHILSIWHGLRLGEICNLECSDFIWETNIAHIKIRKKPHLKWQPKTKKSERDIPIHPDWKEYLFKVWTAAKKKSNFFLLSREKQQLSRDGVSSYTRKLFQKLGFPSKEVSFHCGRHTFATKSKDGGGDREMTSKLLGHSNVAITTEIYTDFKAHEHFATIKNVVININRPKDTL